MLPYLRYQATSAIRSVTYSAGMVTGVSLEALVRKDATRGKDRRKGHDRMLKQLLLGLLLASGLLSTAHAQESSATPSPDEMAGTCQISIIETQHLKVERVFRNTDPQSSCDIEFTSKEHVSGEGIGVLFYPRKMGLDYKYGMGFLRVPGKPGQWRFEGTSDRLLESRIIKRSLTQEKNGDEELLVGHQLLRGKQATGGPIDMPGIRILRLTPQFAISVELNFEPTFYEQQTKGYKQLREAISEELVEIVKSLRPTPGKAGPMVRRP